MDSFDPKKQQALVSSANHASNSKRKRKSQNRSQDITAGPTLKLMAYVQASSEVVKSTMEFHMTIRTKISELTPRQAAMLLSVSVTRAVEVGTDFTLYLCLEFLTNWLRKSGVDVLYVKNEKVRQTLLLAELVLASLKGNWFNLAEMERLPQQVIEEIKSTDWLPTDRQLQSWKQHWELERYLEVRIVPVESLLDRQPSTAERYSGYTRGYGQDGNAPSPGKTKPNSDLDGEDFVELPPAISLQEFDKYNTVLLAIESAKARKKQT